MPRKPTPSILEDAMNASGDEETQADETLGEISVPAPKPKTTKKRSTRAKTSPKKDEEIKMDTLEEPVEQTVEATLEVEPEDVLVESPVSVEELESIPEVQAEVEEAVEEAEAEAELEEAVEAEAELEEVAEAEAELEEAAEADTEAQAPPSASSQMYKPMRVLMLAGLGLVSYSIEIVGKLVERGELTQKEGMKLMGELSKNAKFPLPAGLLHRGTPAQPIAGDEPQESSETAAESTEEGDAAEASLEDQEIPEGEDGNNGEEEKKKQITTNNIFTINFLSFGSPVMVDPNKKKKAPLPVPEPKK